MGDYLNIFKGCLRGLTVDQALSLLDDDGEEADEIERVYITPPEPAVLTDEDSGGEEEESGNVLPDRLSAQQLWANAEVRYRSGKDDMPDEPDDIPYDLRDADEEQNPSDHEPHVSQVPLTKSSSGQSLLLPSGMVGKRKWLEGDICAATRVFQDAEPQPDESPWLTFHRFFDNEVIDMIFEQTVKYAHEKNPQEIIKREEILCAIGILILSGYHNLPGVRHYWDSSEDLGVNMVKNAMRRNKFISICRNLHFVDNSNLDRNDRVWKLRPLINLLREKMIANFSPMKYLSYDESMVRYFGRHGLKQYLKNKPSKFGYKVWSLNTSEGYLVNFEIYQGKSTATNELYDKYFGKCASPLLTMLDQFPDDLKGMPFSLFFDNLFTSLPLISHLRERGYGATGTARVNRLPKETPMSNNAVVNKKDRGYFESTISKNEGAIVVKWKDNSAVTVCSNEFGVNPVQSAKRFDRKTRKSVLVPQPMAVSQYNKFMGGTDRMDQNISAYRTSIRIRKWYWPLFTWLLDACLNNAWLLHRKKHPKITQLHFKRSVAIYLLETYGAPPAPGASRRRASIDSQLRFSGSSHLVAYIPDKKRRRCAGRCNSSVRTMCIACDRGLCIDCFAGYHTPC